MAQIRLDVIADTNVGNPLGGLVPAPLRCEQTGTMGGTFSQVLLQFNLKSLKYATINSAVLHMNTINSSTTTTNTSFDVMDNTTWNETSNLLPADVNNVYNIKEVSVPTLDNTWSEFTTDITNGLTHMISSNYNTIVLTSVPVGGIGYFGINDRESGEGAYIIVDYEPSEPQKHIVRAYPKSILLDTSPSWKNLLNATNSGGNFATGSIHLPESSSENFSILYGMSPNVPLDAVITKVSVCAKVQIDAYFTGGSSKFSIQAVNGFLSPIGVPLVVSDIDSKNEIITIKNSDLGSFKPTPSFVNNTLGGLSIRIRAFNPIVELNNDSSTETIKLHEVWAEIEYWTGGAPKLNIAPKVNGNLGSFMEGYCKVNNVLRPIVDGWTKVNGNLVSLLEYKPPVVSYPIPTNGRILHFDARNTGSIVRDGDNKVLEWRDISGSDNHATPPQAQYAPTYENGMIKFNDAHALEFNQLDLQTGSTVFFVANVASGKPAAHQIISNNIGVNAQLRVEATNGQFRLVGSPAIGGSGSYFGYDTLNQAGARFTPTTGQTFNYNSFGNIGTPTSTTIPVNQIGARVLTGSELLIGDIGEIIIYNRALTDSEIAQVNDYLRYKWIEEPIVWDGNYRNLALEGTATASSENKTTENASLAIDGDTTSAGSRWISASTDTNIWLEVNLGKSCKIDKIDVYTGNRYPDVVSIVSTYTLQVNKDGVWVDIVAVTGNTEYHRSHTLTATITDKVRMIFPNQTGYQRIYELEIYGEGGTAK